jgi:hypothetical protein
VQLEIGGLTPTILLDALQPLVNRARDVLAIEARVGQEDVGAGIHAAPSYRECAFSTSESRSLLGRVMARGAGLGLAYASSNPDGETPYPRGEVELTPTDAARLRAVLDPIIAKVPVAELEAMAGLVSASSRRR